MSQNIRKPHEPEAVEILNPNGNSPFIISCEHASNIIPEGLGTLGLTEEQLATDVVFDIGAGEVTRGICQRLNARGVLSGYSRLVIDCNRTPGEDMSIPETSQRGFPVPGNHNLTKAQKHTREEEFFWPYHHALQSRFEEYIAMYNRPPIMVSVHSFAPEYHGVERPWHIGVLWNKDKRVAEPLITLLAEDNTIHVGDNLPYTAQDEVSFGYAVCTHAESKGYPHVMLEIRANEIDTAAKAAEWAERVVEALRKLDVGGL